MVLAAAIRRSFLPPLSVQEDEDTLPRTTWLAVGRDNKVLLAAVHAAEMAVQSTEPFFQGLDREPCVQCCPQARNHEPLIAGVLHDRTSYVAA